MGLGSYFDYSGGWDAIYAHFTRPVESITVRYVNGSTDDAWLIAFGVNGKLIDGGPIWSSASTSCLRLIPVGSTTPVCYYNISDTLSYDSPTPIGSILIGSSSAAGYITSIDIPGLPVPEPSAIGLLASGFLIMGIAIARLRRERLP
jgi:hypothetical protein